MAQSGHVNRFVDYLNTLRTQTEAGNAFCVHEARGQSTSLAQFGLSPSATYTRTKLESIVPRDVVLWYRVGKRYLSGPRCTMVGPTIRLTGGW